MTDRDNSYRQILRASSIIGGASFINILISLLRVKVVALMMGPAGVGLVGLSQNLIAIASTLSAMGFGNAGTRQIAEATGSGNVDDVDVARRALYLGTLLLAILGASAFWLLRSVLAQHVLGDQSRAAEVGWLTIGVALTVVAGYQSALLNGLRRIGDFARVSVLSALLSTVLGVGGLLYWGEDGLLLFVLAGPIAAFIVGQWYVMRIPKPQSAYFFAPGVMKQWKVLFRLGTTFMLAGLAVTAGQLAVRSMVQQQLGPDALGNFQASWMISMTYIGFVLTAMGTDYYPRLTAVIGDPLAVNRLVNEQTEVALLLAAPVLLFVSGLAPWVIEVAYSNRFAEAAGILQIQILADVLKVASWPLGFILLASGAGKTFMLSDIFAIVILSLGVWFGLPLIGLQATGVGFVVMYAVYLALVHSLAKMRTGFSWEPAVVSLIAIVSGACLFTCIVSYFNSIAAAVSGVLLAILFSFNAIKRLRDSVPIVKVIDAKLHQLSRVLPLKLG